MVATFDSELTNILASAGLVTRTNASMQDGAPTLELAILMSGCRARALLRDGGYDTDLLAAEHARVPVGDGGRPSLKSVLLLAMKYAVRHRATLVSTVHVLAAALDMDRGALSAVVRSDSSRFDRLRALIDEDMAVHAGKRDLGPADLLLAAQNVLVGLSEFELAASIGAVAKRIVDREK